MRIKNTKVFVGKTHTIEQNDFTIGCKRLIDWERGKPYTWGSLSPEDDFDTLMNSHCLFARKFDERVNFDIIQHIYDALKERQAGATQ